MGHIPKSFSAFRQSRQPAHQFIRFGMSSAVTVCVKIGLTWALAQVMNDYLSYFITHIVILFWSYFSHLKFSFNEEHTWHRFGEYAKAVFLIKLSDYLLFTVVLNVTDGSLTLSVLLASLIMAIIRFVAVRRAMAQRGKTEIPVDESIL